MAEREIEAWITVNGSRVPIFKGESKSDAINRSIAKSNEDKKARDIARNKKEAEKASGKKDEYTTWRDELVRDITKDVNANTDPSELISNGDIQSVVEAYAMTHKGVDEEKILKDIEKAVQAKLKSSMGGDITGDKILTNGKGHKIGISKEASESKDQGRKRVEDMMKKSWGNDWKSPSKR